MARPWCSFCAKLLLLLFISCNVTAAVLEVAPVQLSLSSTEKIGVLKITNRSDEDSLLQLELVSWQQKEGKDIYQPSHDIFMTPPLFKLPGHQTQVIRFALRHPVLSHDQQAYRLNVKEIDPSKVKHQRLGQHVYFLMNFSLPLLVQPDHIIERYTWSAQRIDAQHISLHLYNEGNVALSIHQWQLLDKQYYLPTTKQSTFAYIFPRQSHSWIATIHSNSNPTDIESKINGQTKKSRLSQL
jgi:fimbrial chaperone protein